FRGKRFWNHPVTLRRRCSWSPPGAWVTVMGCADVALLGDENAPAPHGGCGVRGWWVLSGGDGGGGVLESGGRERGWSGKAPTSRSTSCSRRILRGQGARSVRRRGCCST